ncbi:MAG: molybdopterin dinucleotide-binding protein [Thiotrichales bacterium]|nr:molybdopterin dinucleotide-binding protein [Thiotrichales bacterium]
MKQVHKSFCRVCLNACALEVAVEDDRVVDVSGDPHDPLFKGYTCVKGRNQSEYLYHPERLRHSLKRMPNGLLEPIPVEQAMDEIAEKLTQVRDQAGARAIASYAGTMLFTSYTSTMPMLDALMDVIGSPMRFNTDTIDKGGKLVALSLHGDWMAPAQGFDEPQVMMLIGINPVVTFTGLPTGNPGAWLKQRMRQGMRLIVIDPRRTTVAKRADLHLRPAPGFDVDIIACFIRTILEERRHDRAFVEQNCVGVEALRRSVAPFDAETVSKRTGVRAAALIEAARLFSGSGRGYVMAGTGPHMAGQGTLTEYLVLVLQTLCGYWLREGERVAAIPSLLPTPDYKAQPTGPDSDWCFGQFVGHRGLRETRAGPPIIELPAEMLRDDEHRVRALVCVGGNPVAALPDTARTIQALDSLELFVQVDPWMSRSARRADYVIAPTLPLEAAASTQAMDQLTGWTGYGLGSPYANYTAAVARPPADSDVIDDWKFLHGVAVRMGFDGQLRGRDGRTHRIDPQCSTEEFIEVRTRGARVDLGLVRKHNGGSMFPDDGIRVAARDVNCEARFDFANADMVHDLEVHANDGPPAESADPGFEFRLVCRRHMQVYNSSCHFPGTLRKKPYNPAYMNPTDLEHHGLQSGDHIKICSAHGEVRAVVEADADVARGLVSMMFGFGTDDTGTSGVGTDPNPLIRWDAVHDPYTGQPRMSNVPVNVQPWSPVST